MSDRITYLPGTDSAFVGPRCVLLLPAGTSAATEVVWPLVRDGADIDLVLEALAAGGMRAMGPFALLHGHRAVLRGTGRAVLIPSGLELTGAPFMTWAEHGVDDGQQVRLSVGHGGAAPVDGAEELPLVAGVVQAAGVTVATRPEASGDGSGEPAHSAAGRVAAAPALPVQHPATPEPEPQPEPEPEPDPEPPPAGGSDEPAAVQPVVPGPPVSGSASPDTVAPDWTEGVAAAGTGAVLVDGIPDFGAGPEDAGPEEESYDHLFGETVHRSLEEAGVRPADPDDEAQPAGEQDTDHDGSTVLRADLAALRAGAGSSPVPAPGAPQVLGVPCPAGHGNPPGNVECRDCAAPLPDMDPVPIPRPSLGRLCVSDGSQAELDRTVLIGRSPTASRFSADELPHLLRVGGQQQDISRTHAEVRVEDWNVLVVDRSANGTWLVRPGAEPQRLHKDEPVLVLPGSLLDLGDGITVRYEAGAS